MMGLSKLLFTPEYYNVCYLQDPFYLPEEVWILNIEQNCLLEF